MSRFIVIYLYFALTFEFCPFFWNLFGEFFYNNRFVFYILFLLIYFVFWSFFKKKEKFNNNNDLILKFFKILTTKISKFVTFFVIEFKKFYIFSIFFKYYQIIKTNVIFFGNKFSKLFIIWRPLFKKWSYFGYYRSNRSKWIK